MLAVQQQVSAEVNRRMVGKTVEVIIEGESKLVSRQSKTASSFVQLTTKGRRESLKVEEHRTQLVGRTRGDQVVCFDGDLSLKGQILDVEITDAQNMTLFGKLVGSPAA